MLLWTVLMLISRSFHCNLNHSLQDAMMFLFAVALVVDVVVVAVECNKDLGEGNESFKWLVKGVKKL